MGSLGLRQHDVWPLHEINSQCPAMEMEQGEKEKGKGAKCCSDTKTALQLPAAQKHICTITMCQGLYLATYNQHTQTASSGRQCSLAFNKPCHLATDFIVSACKCLVEFKPVKEAFSRPVSLLRMMLHCCYPTASYYEHCVMLFAFFMCESNPQCQQLEQQPPAPAGLLTTQ